MKGNYHGNKRYVSALKHVRELRRDQTEAERALWQLLRRRQFAGAKFRRQHQFGPYILDFFCVEHRLAIEADGGQHFSDEGLSRDEMRTQYLARQGVHVLRFTNVQILGEIDGVAMSIEQSIIESPHPNPLPEGEGT